MSGGRFTEGLDRSQGIQPGGRELPRELHEPEAPSQFPEGTGQHRITEIADDNLPRSLRAAGYPIERPAGSVIFKDGDSSSSLYVVLHGAVSEVIIDRKTGRSVRVGEYGPGVFFGELAYMTGARRTTTAIAMTDVDLMEVQGPALQALVARDPRIQTGLARQSRRRLVSLIAASMMISRPFATLTAADRAAIISALQFRRVPAGDVTVNRGECADGLGFVALGTLEEYLPGTKFRSLRTLNRGDIYNERSIIDAGPARASIHALEPAGVFVLPRREFRQLEAQDPTFRARFEAGLRSG